MPDPDKLSPKDRRRLLGCVAGKNEAWKKKNNKSPQSHVPQDVNQKHYSECARELGLE